ncbi:MAG: FMN-binding negative transcriptional regulator, partial [Alphaproteobacteria bacterium]|nr:FMN-binding negative transcriptional regulator [Alphaproteobacteria bacterium]
MYVPTHFEPSDRRIAGDVIDANPFALIVSHRNGEPVGTHLPLDLDRSRGALGTLVGHLARANDHWQAMDGATVLSVFSGPHAYVSPRW